MENFSTPMMRQYREIKAKYTDCLLFYRMGDFYELFLEDAKIGSKVLNITLTSKAGGKDGKIPMAGIPYHAVDTYLTKLVKSGYKVAICEQLSPPNKKGLVERDVIRVVTPGTLMDENALEQKTNNYIVSLRLQNDMYGMAIADISTGYFAALEFSIDDEKIFLRDQLAQLNPSECILPDDLYNNPILLKFLQQQKGMNLYCFSDWEKYENSTNLLRNHFGVKTLTAFGIEDKMLARHAASALLGYLQETQKSTVSHIQKVTFLERKNTMLLDKSTMLNLELFSTIREHDSRGSLLSTLDATQTAMGGRMLKEWIKNPLLSKEGIFQRHESVAFFLGQNQKREKIRASLLMITDIERILSRLSVGIGNARDLVNLKNALENTFSIKTVIKNTPIPLLKTVEKNISKEIEKVIHLIKTTIVDEPPAVDLREGNLIRQKVSTELDKLRLVVATSQKHIQKLEQKEKDKTGISSLKIRYNQVFGFYIEISKTNAHLAPKHYMRKQTLVNGERFITQELKKYEEIILSAQEKAHELEYQLFLKTLKQTLSFTPSIQELAQSIATLDCITTFAHISLLYNYTRPKLIYSGELRITQGRHPVVERLLPDEEQFVPNDVSLDNINQSLLLLTGPNMAGKSVFIRQIALIALLNQIGCFVPAASAHLSIMDRIFVRSGASDVITSGLSTFMVEMVETAHILHNATSKSLIVMDEIGRGTSTYDGISIAWAIAEYLVKTFRPSPKTLFATHYHELQALEKEYPHAIKNFHMAVADDSGEPLFLHTLLPGPSSHSFGVAVAKLAGIPREVIEKATTMLLQLERRNTPKDLEESTNLIPSRIAVEKTTQEKEIIATHLIQKSLEGIDVANMTPLEALNKLADLKDQLKLLDEKSKLFIEAD